MKLLEATVTEIMHLLDMKASDFMLEWKNLPDSYKAWYKVQATKELEALKGPTGPKN